MSQHFCSENQVESLTISFWCHLISGVFAQLGQLHPVVGQVVDHEDEGAHPMHLIAPAECEKSEGGNVVDEHLPEVFSLHVGELGDQEGPVEGHLEHVVPPNCWICKNMMHENNKRKWDNLVPNEDMKFVLGHWDEFGMVWGEGGGLTSWDFFSWNLVDSFLPSSWNG